MKILLQDHLIRLLSFSFCRCTLKTGTWVCIRVRFVFVHTLRQSSSTDISSHAAAFEVCWMVAGHDLYFITGKVLQVGYDCRLLWEHFQLHLRKKRRERRKYATSVSDLWLHSSHMYKTIYFCWKYQLSSHHGPVKKKINNNNIKFIYWLKHNMDNVYIK